MNLHLVSCFLFVFFLIRYSLIAESTSKGWVPIVIGEVPLENTYGLSLLSIYSLLTH